MRISGPLCCSMRIYNKKESYIENLNTLDPAWWPCSDGNVSGRFGQLLIWLQLMLSWLSFQKQGAKSLRLQWKVLPTFCSLKEKKVVLQVNPVYIFTSCFMTATTKATNTTLIEGKTVGVALQKWQSHCHIWSRVCVCWPEQKAFPCAAALDPVDS